VVGLQVEHTQVNLLHQHLCFKMKSVQGSVLSSTHRMVGLMKYLCVRVPVRIVFYACPHGGLHDTVCKTKTSCTWCILEYQMKHWEVGREWQQAGLHKAGMSQHQIKIHHDVCCAHKNFWIFGIVFRFSLLQGKQITFFLMVHRLSRQVRSSWNKSI